MSLEHANPVTGGFLLALIILFWVMLRRSRNRSEKSYIRRIPGIDALDEAVGRAAELGRPIVFTTGLTSLGPVLYACLGILEDIAKKAAQYRIKLLLPQSAPDVMALIEERTRDAYRQVGRQHNFDPQNLIYLSDEQFAYSSGYVGLVHREKAASTFLFGQFNAESLILSDAGQQVGAMQVAGSVDPEQASFFVATCDYTLIGEELFAASAYISREPTLLGSLATQDIGKLFLMILILVGVGLETCRVYLPEYAIPSLSTLMTGANEVVE